MQQAISYRDNAGFVIVRESSVKRYINFAYSAAYDHLMHSGLYRQLTDKGLMISHTEITSSEKESCCFYKILSPENIRFISFPYEWSASQWKTVVLTYLQINKICLDYGMILKDATPFNFTFYKGRCVFFDTLSFSLYEEKKPWLAYRQFCESMLGPLSLIYFNNSRWSTIFQSNINGFPLTFISANLPLRTLLKLPLLLHIHWHSKFINESTNKVKESGLTKEKLLILLNMIERSVQQWKFTQIERKWINYYATNIQSNDYLQGKIQTITKWLQNISPTKVIDLGANNGMFSIIASRYAKQVLSVESDHTCIEKMRKEIQDLGISNVETIWADISQPLPGLGWNNTERAPLLKRIMGDTVMALALIHHLCISANVPIHFVAELLSELTTKYLMIEFVPRSDVKVRQMLSNREDIFSYYNREEFERCFALYFSLLHIDECISSGRILYLWQKK